MKGFTTRVAQPSDDASVSALLKVSYSMLLARDYSPEILDLALPLMCRANSDLLTSGTYYVTENRDGHIVACGGWALNRPGPADSPDDVREGLAHIRHVATHPAWTRRGIGRALVERCKTEARNCAISRFECYSSLSARSFYAALDFRACGSIDIVLGDGCLFPSVVMECAL